MSDKSPLFISSLELLAHATELYALAHARKYKFVILHLANSVELLLKDMLLDQGISIYKKPSETISIWASFEELTKLGASFPEKPVLELLIDDRNTIQHRFGFPDASSVYYYLDYVVRFFQRIFSSHYNIELSEALSSYLKPEELQLIGLSKDEFAHIDKLFAISPTSAVTESYKLLEKEVRSILPTLSSLHRSTQKLPWSHAIETRMLLKHLEREEILENATDMFSKIRQVRNQSAHSDEPMPAEALRESIVLTRELLTALHTAREKKIPEKITNSIVSRRSQRDQALVERIKQIPPEKLEHFKDLTVPQEQSRTHDEEQEEEDFRKYSDDP